MRVFPYFRGALLLVAVDSSGGALLGFARAYRLSRATECRAFCAPLRVRRAGPRCRHGVPAASTGRRVVTKARMGSERLRPCRLPSSYCLPGSSATCPRAYFARSWRCGEPGAVVNVPCDVELCHQTPPGSPASRERPMVGPEYARQLRHLCESLCLVEPAVDGADDVLFGGDSVGEQLLEKGVAVDRAITAGASAGRAAGGACWSPAPGIRRRR
jgi:hypothetical protein